MDKAAIHTLNSKELKQFFGKFIAELFEQLQNYLNCVQETVAQS